MSRVDACGPSNEAQEVRGLAAALAVSLDANFEAFVAMYQHRLFGFVLTLTGNASEAEEIAHDAFVSAYKALVGYEPARRKALALRAWLFTIALNKVRNRARKRPNASIDEALEGGLQLVADARETPEGALESDERVRAVRDALAALPERYRMPVLLRHIEGFSYEEIAATLHRPVGTAKSNVHRGLDLLRASSALSGVR